MIRPSFLVTIALLLGACGSFPPKTEAIPPQSYGWEQLTERQPQIAKIPDDTFLRLVDTGQKNSFGNPILRVEKFAQGQFQGAVLAVSGRAHTQNRDRRRPGSQAPLPNGRYGVPPTIHYGPWGNPELGDKWIDIVGGSPRTALGFHLDPSFNIDPQEDGTDGCVGLINREHRDRLFDWIAIYKPSYLEVSLK